MRSVALTRPGMLAPGIAGLADFQQAAGSGAALEQSMHEYPAPSGISSRQLRRLSPLTRSAIWAAHGALQPLSQSGDTCGVLAGLTHGATGYLREFHDYLIDCGPENVSPNLFSNGVTNATLGALSALFGLHRGGATVVGFEACGLDVLAEATDSITFGDYSACIAGAAEEYSPLVESVYRQSGWCASAAPGKLPAPGHRAGFGAGEGSVFFGVTPVGKFTNAHVPFCLYTPIDDLFAFEKPVDLIVSGAAGGPQDRFELEALSRILAVQPSPPALRFTKQIVRETFAPGALWSVALAWDTIVNQVAYPSFPIHENIHHLCGNHKPIVQSALVIAGSREGTVAGGYLQAAEQAGV